ncbi:hypothetical protein ACLMJK_005280 [Lecanora helva]
MSEDDGDWKPNGRPQSTMARNFSASLNDAFSMDTNLDQLVQSVEQKYVHSPSLIVPFKLNRDRKKAVSSQNAELEAIEAKLRQTEERLKEKSRTSSPAGRAVAGTSSPHRRQPLGNTFDANANSRQHNSAASPGQAHASGVSPITMSQWRPTAQETPSGARGIARDVSTEQVAEQSGNRYSQ